MGDEVLSLRQLNRVTLARQHLLERVDRSPVAMVEELVGLQAQEPHDPYLALWSRIDGFDPLGLAAGLDDRSLVRIVVMRGTIHLVTADDARLLRPLTQPVLDAEIRRHSEFAPLLRDVDITEALVWARERLTEVPLSTTKLRAALAEAFPDLPAAAVAYACRCHLPLVQVPPRGIWRQGGAVTLTPLEAWVGRPLEVDPSIDAVVLRYLAAFGPATVADIASWSRLTAMREVVDRLRPQLRTFRDERGRELVDLPDAPRPDPDVPAPVRVLPEYDNVLLSHADRDRFGAPERRGILGTEIAGRTGAAILADGEVVAVWHAPKPPKGDPPRFLVTHHAMAKRRLAEVEREAARAARFWLGDDAVLELRLVDA